VWLPTTGTSTSSPSWPAAAPTRTRRIELSAAPHSTVVFLRHGQSTWNEASLFTGWANVELTTLGKNEAASAATLLWKEGHVFDVAFTSLLKRAQQTLDIVLQITGQEDVPVHENWRLNERMYGALTGLNKKETAEKYGAAQVKEWRRSFDTPPPPIEDSSPYWPANDNKYSNIAMKDIPRSECLADTIDRTLPYWESTIVPALKRGKTVLVAAHGNSIRGMLKHIDGISNDDIVGLEIPTGVPLVYQLDAELCPIKHAKAGDLLSGVFLGDAAAVAAKQAKVAAESVARSNYDAEEEKNTLKEALEEEGSEMQFMCFGSGCLMLSTSEMRKAFDEVDESGSGLISAAQLKMACDKYGGILAESEGEQLDMSDEDIEQMIKAVDRNGDGMIDFEEYVQALTAM